MNAEEAGAALVQKILSVGIDGMGPVAGAREVAEQHLRQHGDPEAAISRLGATHERIVAASGFATGLGGFATMPISIPTDVAVLYVYQGRLAAATAHLRGYELDSDEVRSVVLLSLLGSSGAALAMKFGVDLSNKMAMQALKQIPGKVFIEINKKVGFRLVTKAGTKGLVNMTKLVPIAGGVAGAGINVASTRAVGRYARSNFPALSLSDDAEG